MSEKCVIKTRKFIANPLLRRKQFVVDVIHGSRPSVPKAELREKLAKRMRVKDAQTIILFGFKIAYGGGRSTGYCLIYDNMEILKKIEPSYRKKRIGVEPKGAPVSRKQIKNQKNRRKRKRGTAKATVSMGKK
eukprot:gnl/Dysnectes_brevis/231_a262_8242.p1 GENE.gnl/Dysnectes_brevis/231_a262_8242~~gnl/Dysnectes_brevis/231_a262_8242.p1  ORF type:complete len:133 (+),score=46.91 gnl/Dysnectes_brevis/231_a262_8242:485-883(+)